MSETQYQAILNELATINENLTHILGLIDPLEDKFKRPLGRPSAQMEEDRIRVAKAIPRELTRNEFEQMTSLAVRLRIAPDMSGTRYGRAVRALSVDPRFTMKAPNGRLFKGHKILPNSPMIYTPNNWYAQGNITYTPDDV